MTLKKLRFRYKTRRPTHIGMYYKYHRQKTPRENNNPRKPSNLKTTVELVTQNSYDRRHKQCTIPLALAKDKGIKQEPFQKNPSWTTPRTTENII